LDPWAVAALRASVAVLYRGIRIITERQPCSRSTAQSRHLGSRPPSLCRQTCARENAPAVTNAPRAIGWLRSARQKGAISESGEHTLAEPREAAGRAHTDNLLC
jgi:hypothetical protein